jgi:hypothetical protein
LEGRLKMTAKSSKLTGYLQLAEGIFSINEDSGVQGDFVANLKKYAKAVNNYITNTYVSQFYNHFLCLIFLLVLKSSIVL